MNIKVNIKKLCEDAILPSYGSEYAAGADLYSSSSTFDIEPQETVLVHTGIAVEIPLGCVGLVYARSGLASKKGLAPANKVGVIDCDYRGEIMVALHNHTDRTQTVDGGERVAQLAIVPFLKADFELCDELSDTVRGEGGFGSTGTK